ncbi:MAG: oligosaccharide flippase family protein [Bacteroidales bacterium]|nr:oligosaccharide flippase family protein [Clostridium sp.]MCM1202924.1 oligosaccharide flippase family protein [Bacteroidales bacterium]
MKAADKLHEMIDKARRTGLGHIFGANTINQIIAFASSFILIRILSKAEFGIYSYAFNIYSFFALVNGFGMESACLQKCSEIARDDEKTDSYMKFAILFGSGVNFLLGCVMGISSLFLSFPLKGVDEILLLFALMPLVTTIFNCMQTYFRYNLLNIEYSKCSVINTLLIFIGSVAGAYLFKSAGLILFRELAMVVSVIIGIGIYGFPAKRIFHALKISVKEKNDMLKLAAISMLNVATGQLLYLIDVFLIGEIISDEMVVASYKTATIIPNALLFIPSALVIYIYPYFARKQEDKKWVKQKFFMILKYFGLLNAVISAGLIVCAPLIIRIVFGSQYLDAVPAFRILTFSYFFSATFRKVIGNLLVTQRKLKVNFWIGIMEALLNVISNWILIHLFGAVGAAITTLIICIVSSVVLMYYFVHYLNRESAKTEKAHN